MAIDGETRFSSMPNESERGAGGKLRRQPARKPPATPYARPPQNQAQRSRWISRLVDPAYRLIAGGATKILPYLLSKASPGNALPAPDTHEQDPDEFQKESKQHADDGDHTWGLSHLESRSTEVGGTSSTTSRGKSNFDSSSQARGKMVLNDDDALSELERLMDGRKFSRDEIDRLIEIIHSRAVDPSDVEEEKKNSEKPSEEAKRSIVALESARKSIEGKKGNMNSDLWATSTPLPKSTRPDDVGLSPVELARAYMGGQTSSLSLISRDETDLLHGDEFAEKPFIASPLCKPSTCWPGARLQEQYGHATPQSQRERFGLHNFPRTPYSRTIYSKSTSKLTQLQDDSRKRLSISQSPFQQLQTSHGQFQSRSKAMDNKQGSVGPICRIRHKAATETPFRGSVFSRSLDRPSQVENPNVSEGFFPAIKKSVEGGTNSGSFSQAANDKHKSSALGNQTVHPHSSQIARTILEHLERNQPTPKDRSAELKLATSWRSSQSSDVHGQNGLPKSRIDFSNIQNANKNGSARWNEDNGNFLSNVSSSVSKVPSGEAENALNKITPASNGIFGSTLVTESNSTTASFEFGKTKDSQIKSKHEEDAAKVVLNSSGAEAPTNDPKPPSHSLGTKPVLPSISVTKPMQKWTFPSGTNTGFTFPVSSSSGVSSEPPTPSIMPSGSTISHQPTLSIMPSSSTISHQPEKEKEDEIPSYSFGTKRPSTPLVFSFPSTSSTPTSEDDVSDIKFTFGSDKTERISFSSLGKDAVCC